MITRRGNTTSSSRHIARARAISVSFPAPLGPTTSTSRPGSDAARLREAAARSSAKLRQPAHASSRHGRQASCRRESVDHTTRTRPAATFPGAITERSVRPTASAGGLRDRGRPRRQLADASHFEATVLSALQAVGATAREIARHAVLAHQRDRADLEMIARQRIEPRARPTLDRGALGVRNRTGQRHVKTKLVRTRTDSPSAAAVRAVLRSVRRHGAAHARSAPSGLETRRSPPRMRPQAPRARRSAVPGAARRSRRCRRPRADRQARCDVTPRRRRMRSKGPARSRRAAGTAPSGWRENRSAQAPWSGARESTLQCRGSATAEYRAPRSNRSRALPRRTDRAATSGVGV